MCSPAMTGGGAAGVGKGLGTGLTEAFTGMRVAREDMQQGKQATQDPRLMQIYEAFGASMPPSLPGPPGQVPRA